MSKKRKSITVFEVRAWHQSPTGVAQACGDGLYFRARVGGVSQWMYRYSLNGRARWLSLGTYPEKSLADARKDLRRQKVAVSDGVDVAVERRRERQASLEEKTLKGLANDWYEHQVKPRIEHPEVVRRRLDNHIIPTIGAIYLDEIRPADIDRLLRKVRKKYPATASNCLRDLKKMFRFAGKREWMDTNPAINFELSDAGGKPQPRKRFLEADELTALFEAMRGEQRFGRLNELAVLLLLALCVRKMELLAARWDEFDLDAGVWSMPEKESATGSRMKKQAIRIPLAPPVVAWLKELYVFAAQQPYLFPPRRITAKQRFPHVSPDTLNWAMKKSLELDLAAFTVHDLRRTARTHLTKLGVDRFVAERALNHKVTGIQAVYEIDDHFNERKKALGLWADRLVELGAC